MRIHYPYRAGVLYDDTWWPESSHPNDPDIVGDGIPGDKKTAEFAARCCNIVYQQALEDAMEFLKEKGISVDLLKMVNESVSVENSMW